jgi:7-carboxy-7-deazaguanine synthase (Cx14CxxC type)
MSYSIKETYYTLQGEGVNAGRPAVFCRFAGCNLWTGREEDRADAVCNFCDTDFVGTDGPGGGQFQTPDDLAERIASLWPANGTGEKSLVVCTGGEPLLQLDEAAVTAIHARGFEVAIETNGTRLPPQNVDWVCVSPKSDVPLVLRSGDELKLIYPQVNVDPAEFVTLDFTHFLLQPMDGAHQSDNIASAIRYCLEHPRWRLSLQTHKLVGLR